MGAAVLGAACRRCHPCRQPLRAAPGSACAAGRCSVARAVPALPAGAATRAGSSRRSTIRGSVGEPGAPGAAGAAADGAVTLRAALGRRIEAGGDDGDAHLVAERVVDDRTEDDVGLGVRRLGDELGGGVDLEQAEVGTAGDVEQHALRAVHAGLEQRARDRLLRRDFRAVLAAGAADTHEGAAGAAT